MNVSGEPLLSPRLLLRALATRPSKVRCSERQGSLSGRLGGQLQLFAYARQALTSVLRDLGTGRILVPAYICDTVVHGIVAAGWRWRYYPLGEDLSPDWQWLERHPDSDDTAILLVHYFGVPSDLSTAARFVESHGVALIEDCAHAFLTAALNPAVGRVGRAAIYSWRKFFPVASGGALVEVAHPSIDIGVLGRQRPGPTGAVHAARELGKWLMFETGSSFILRRFGSALSDEPDRSDVEARGTQVDRTAAKVLAAEAPNLHRIAQRRRDNYRALLESVGGLKRIAPLTPPISEGVVPWCLPLAVIDEDAGRSLVEYLLHRGVGAWPWPELPSDVNAHTFPHESRLAARTVCLPVHQSLGPGHMRHMASVLMDWERNGSSGR